MNIPGLQKIAYKAGATRISSDVYDHIKAVGERYLKSNVKYSIIY
jgi:histone H3/H4